MLSPDLEVYQPPASPLQYLIPALLRLCYPDPVGVGNRRFQILNKIVSRRPYSSVCSRMSFARRAGILGVALLVCALAAAAQQSAPAETPQPSSSEPAPETNSPQAPPAASQTTPSPTAGQSSVGDRQEPQSTPAQTEKATGTQAQSSTAETESEIRKREQSQRMLGVVPMFAVTSRHDAPPLKPNEKFHLMLKSMTDPFAFIAAGLQAGISQAENQFPAYGQGGEGYAKRYGAAFTDSATSNFFSNFVYPVIFKEDPRYFRLGEGTIKRRIGYALEQEVVAHKDTGGRTFHFANVLGAFTSGGISNAYYPPEDRGFGLTMSRSAIALGYGSLGNLLLEFWPDVSNKLFHTKHPHAAPGQPAGVPNP